MMSYNKAVSRYGNTLAGTTCKFPEDGVRTPKHVAAIVYVHRWV
jgi:hypothetical protein